MVYFLKQGEIKRIMNKTIDKIEYIAVNSCASIEEK